MSKLAGDRAPLPAEALTVDSSLLTAISNDYGFEQMFSGQLAGKLTGNDVFPDITMYGTPQTFSGRLSNSALWECRVSCFAGREGGAAKAFAN